MAGESANAPAHPGRPHGRRGAYDRAASIPREIPMKKLPVLLAASALVVSAALPWWSAATAGPRPLLVAAPDAPTAAEAQAARIAALEAKLAAMQDQVSALHAELTEVHYKLDCHWHTLPVPPYALGDNQTKGHLGLDTNKECDPQNWMPIESEPKH
jgi:hypothetical protein